ncbi:NAD-dependent epimerase/dehydratase family protein [Cohnella yongneupensis]|uniref:NAD-dependent epimerase/dehydratase family protein n=1 Tax=Cohnella yongneupensis TaxID=425006 RepID=A0ABW0R6U0_9BACL
MKSILITGAEGFIGRNLIATLERLEQFEMLRIGSASTREQLEQYARQADFVFHLAGVNRSADEGDFEKGNVDLTERLLQALRRANKQTPVVFSSSTQAGNRTPYGQSKQRAEEALFTYSEQSGADVFVFRLPNVFGKWCKPNYNSVIATWCHNTARGIPIRIDNPETELTLTYVDDVIRSFVEVVQGKEQAKEYGFCEVSPVYRVKLGAVADKLTAFRDSRETLESFRTDDLFSRYLYSTYLSYMPNDGFAYELQMKHDHRGWLAEFIKSQQFGQIFISRTKPGITRGNHWHHTKVEKFLVIEGDATIKFRHIDSDNQLEYRVSGQELKVLDIPPGYTHSITNTGDGDVITLFWANEIFNAERPDTYFLEV